MKPSKLHKLAFIVCTGLMMVGMAGCNANTSNSPASAPESPENVSQSPDSTTPESPENVSQTPASSAPPKSNADSLGVRIFIDDQGLAIRGTDPVAYFTESRPVAGSPEFSYTWNEATWQFSSAENRDKFAENPEQYAPQYGGFCAWAVSQGKTATTDPEAWKIVDGKLYLNYSRERQEAWEEDIPGNIEKADANWLKGIAGS